MTKQVSIIGGSGFIGSYMTQKFLNEGYSVKISVTDKSKVEKYQHIAAMGDVEIEACDVLKPASVQAFLQGTQNLVHVGSPFYFGAYDNEKEVIEPTVLGTLNVLEAAKEVANLNKVLLVSSTVAINGYVPVSAYDPQNNHTDRMQR